LTLEMDKSIVSLFAYFPELSLSVTFSGLRGQCKTFWQPVWGEFTVLARVIEVLVVPPWYELTQMQENSFSFLRI
jgi:hypothetical protein